METNRSTDKPKRATLGDIFDLERDELERATDKRVDFVLRTCHGCRWCSMRLEDVACCRNWLKALKLDGGVGPRVQEHREMGDFELFPDEEMGMVCGFWEGRGI